MCRPTARPAYLVLQQLEGRLAPWSPAGQDGEVGAGALTLCIQDSELP